MMKSRFWEIQIDYTRVNRTVASKNQPVRVLQSQKTWSHAAICAYDAHLTAGGAHQVPLKVAKKGTS